MIARYYFIVLLLTIATSVSATAQSIDFDRQVKPILSDRCFMCHGPDGENRAADLRLDILDDVADYVLSPGEPDNSELIRRIESHDEDEVMPPPSAKLSVSKSEIEIIKQWIAEGAKWEQHWSFVAPEAGEIPVVKNSSVAKSPLDHFVLARLETENLTFAPPASKEKLLRRVTFDLTGLSPTLEELDAFLADDSADAFEKVVDRLLASSRYGERMTSDWLDLARYSDTYGYQVDMDRFVWPWRDWVIRAFNENKPFDEFTIEQLAGDLLPNPTDDQILATTFNRLNPQKVEGGSVEEEFRVEYVADRSQTVGMLFLGLTVECARCHDHKFDPLSQQEYYQLFSFFNNIDEAGLYSYYDPEAIPTPSMLLLDAAKKQTLAELKAAVTQSENAAAEIFAKCTSDDADSPFQNWLKNQEARTELAKLPTEKLLRQIEVPGELNPGGNQKIEAPDGQTGILLTGDDEVRVAAGKFSRDQPFSVAARINIPPTPDGEPIDRNVIFHCSQGWTDSASRGYQLIIENGKLSASLIHFWPGSAISVRTTELVATDQWLQVTMTYDGSSRADGIGIYIDGKRQPVEIVRDNLQKKILGSGTDGLVIGARSRDRGFAGGRLSEFRVFDRELSEIETAHLHDAKSLTDLLNLPEEKLTGEQRDLLKNYFANHHCENFTQRLNELKEKRMAVATFIDQQAEIMVMQELPQPRPAFVLDRGAYDAPTTPVSASTPAILPPLKTDNNRPANRLDLARWLVDGKNPLTARVMANHYWQLLFGAGLVRTPEDFGSQGSQPTHPELLDWLALNLQTDWDLKRFLKLLVMSATYQQSSVASAELLQRDPANELLARAPTFRLPAEMLRDNVLFQSGLLVEKIGGSPVKPYEVAVAFTPATPDTGEGLYRRSLYTYWKRSGPAPVMMTLDAAKRDVCQVKRERTSSPLQALVMLNGTQFIEAARKLGERLMIETAATENTGSDKTEAIATSLFRCLTSRKPTDTELNVLTKLYQQQLSVFEKDPSAITELLSVGESKSEIEQQAELAAWTTVASMLMNFDECVVKR